MGDMSSNWSRLYSRLAEPGESSCVRRPGSLPPGERLKVLRALAFPICSVYAEHFMQIDVQTPEDVAAAIAFAKSTGVRIVVKNTGHDYIGRSSAPDSLMLSVRNVQGVSLPTRVRRHYDR